MFPCDIRLILVCMVCLHPHTTKFLKDKLISILVFNNSELKDYLKSFEFEKLLLLYSKPVCM